MYEIAQTLGPIICVVGARPNYMKMAPLIRAFRIDATAPRTMLIHTGQHYDVAMNDRLFADLKLATPDVNLEVGSGTHAQQTAEIMRRFEPVVDDAPPSCVVVVGDVNSTLACSLVAVKKGIPVVHVEAGLRSFDRTMPEEINRLLTDQICDVLYTTERSAAENLRREGIPMERVHFVGNVMIDSLDGEPETCRPAERGIREQPSRYGAARRGARFWSRDAAPSIQCRPEGQSCRSVDDSRGDQPASCRWSARCTREREPTSSVSDCGGCWTHDA